MGKPMQGRVEQVWACLQKCAGPQGLSPPQQQKGLAVNSLLQLESQKSVYY